MYVKVLFFLAGALCALGAVVVQVPKSNDTPKEHWEKPAFCNDLDCPEFSVIEKTESYEHRQYKKSMWVKTSESAIEIDDVRRRMFYALFRYISGANDKKQKVAMTAPVTIEHIPGQGPACESNFTMGFFIADKVAPNAPKPTEAGVYLETNAPFKAYVRSYGGYSTREIEAREVAALYAALPKSAKVYKKLWYFAGYNSPFDPIDRHNEVWLIQVE